MKKLNKSHLIIFISLFVIFIIGQFVYTRIDMTKDKRFTLTSTTEKLVENVKQPLKIEILLGGDLTGDYRILKNEIQFLLDELREKNSNISYSFIDPLDLGQAELEQNQLAAVPIKTDKGLLNVYPYAKLTYGDKTTYMEVLVNDPSTPFNELALASSEKLEYLFAEKIQKVTNFERKRIGFVVHHDELPEANIQGLGSALSEKYDAEIYLNPIVNKTLSFQPSDLDSLKRFDALIVAKPTLPFSDMDKLVLDQYVMNGGKLMMAVETVDAEMDSIFRSGKIVAFPRDLKLNDFLFNYGVRIHPAVIKDMNGAQIVLADGETAGNTSYNYYNWPYFELGVRGEENPITSSIDPVLFQFANPIELLKNPNIKQTVLLSTTEQTSLKPSMNYIQLDEVNIESPEEYRMGKIPMAVLLEGNFNSAYAMRYERKEFPNFKAKTVDGKMIVISDGDVLKNSLWRGVPMQLGENKFSVRPDNPDGKPKTYANQTFVMNAMDYLLGDADFLALRNRKLEIPLLSETAVIQEKSTWQMINLIVPTAIIALLGGIGFWLRKKKYAK
ncbi:gliding-associated putative ABC transporter substrate-binding component GldG [Chishuiella changwenlii]|uniref:Gliding motility-associated ABC transporter substrate-binding protein GldG n=1 Tax=Chishuiella changwenlii TaxID=1434701 RepID=A0A1M6TNB2_9FLAO|nr:gliding motility-associated ABC transporter substrate-binding protein GldG [Chishuiella changwenlii]GGF03737.1 gliding motility-associated ABC transporter substrate-binding protein GldG [Chishuiella changwenlii]SHK58424.1 gliding-associated putative ABC transporter substrate-binding component GldG [Chishuiella changwenlii]